MIARPKFYEINMLEKEKLLKVLAAEKYIAAVIHFAASKAVAESVIKPLKYFKNNLFSLITLLECMETFGIRNIVFSSSATVYGEADELPVTESTAFKKFLSAYGSTKQMGEDILEKVAATGNIHCIALRYFNPVGAHTSGLLGELPIGIPNNLMPFITQTAAGLREELVVFGNDYDTSDGTCIRDYVHVVDLAKATTILGIILSIATAYVARGYNSIMDLLQLVFSFVNAPLFATFFLGMLWKRTTANGAFYGLLSRTAAAALTHGLTTAEGKGGWIANLHTFYSGTSQAFNIAWIAFVVCFIITLFVSLFTKLRPESSLVGLMYSLTPRQKDSEKVWYKNRLVLGIIVLLATLALNIIF
jgi:dTDP-4-dehydrorhamnose reductase